MTSSSRPDRADTARFRDPAGLGAGDLALDRVRYAGLCLALAGAAASNSLASIGCVTYLAASVASGLRRPRSVGTLPAPALFAAFAAALAVSTVLNGFPAESGRGILKYVSGFLLMHAGLHVLNGRRRWLGLAALLLTLEAVAATSGIGQDFFGRDFLRGRLPMLYTEDVTRITGPFKHCNDFATFLIPGWIFGAAWLVERFRRRSFWAVAAALFLALIGWAMIRTMSRGAMIGAACGTALLILTLPYRKWTVSVMAALAAAVWLVPSPLATRLHELTRLGGSLGERMYLLRSTLKMVEASPWFGLGPNTFSRWFPVYNPPDPAAPVIMYAHNSYLQIAAEIGWVGLGLFLAILAALLWKSWNRVGSPASADPLRWIRAAALASAAGILVNALFESLLQSTQLRTLFWCVLGVAAAGCCGAGRHAVTGRREKA